MQKLVAALIERADSVVPVFRDLHLAYSYDLEPQFQLLAQRFPGPISSAGSPELSALPPARQYAQAGAGARDPRTGAVVARFRDVLAGKLDPLLEAWRNRSTAAAAAPLGQ